MNPKEFFLEVPWGRIAVVTYNSEKLPLVIFCHGRSDSADTFLPLIQLLPPTYHYVTFDLPGCGYSDKLPPGGVFMFNNFLPMLKLVADHYGERKFIFIAHSMGATIGRLYNIVTDGDRITKFVDIDSMTSINLEPYPSESYPIDTFPDGGYSLKEYLYSHFIHTCKPEVYKKQNAPLETAPSYTMEQCIELMKNVRHLPPHAAGVVLKRNLRPDPKIPGKYKLVWDQRFKTIARPPFSSNFLFAVRKRYPLPTLLFVSSDTISKLQTQFTRDMVKLLQENMPYFKMVNVEGFHDIHLTAAEQIASNIVEFMHMDLAKIKAKQLSKI